jgi:hypothetical protein
MRRIRLKKPGGVIPCPKCGNNTEFAAHSSQVSEDCCEVWVVCSCGFDPTACDASLRYEDTWGGTSDGNVLVALECWTEAIRDGEA